MNLQAIGRKPLVSGDGPALHAAAGQQHQRGMAAGPGMRRGKDCSVEVKQKGRMLVGIRPINHLLNT
jgi:hypothetical protein